MQNLQTNVLTGAIVKIETLNFERYYKYLTQLYMVNVNQEQPFIEKCN